MSDKPTAAAMRAAKKIIGDSGLKMPPRGSVARIIDAEFAELVEALRQVREEAQNQSEAFYEDARQCSVERDRTAERSAMAKMHAWEKMVNLAQTALAKLEPKGGE